MRRSFEIPARVADERGYTLQEVLATVAVIGILSAIAIVIFLALLERWRVDAAINQVAADMRLAHTRATGQLTDWRMVMTTGSAEYSLVKLRSPYEDGAAEVPPAVQTTGRSLPAGTMLFSSTARAAASDPDAHEEFFVEFNSDGTIHVINGPNGSVRVSSDDRDPTRKLTYLSATSRISVDP